MMRRARRRQPTRAELIDRKHQLEGEIRTQAAEIRRLRAQNKPTAHAESRLDRLRDLQYRTRQEIDRADPGRQDATDTS